MTTYNPPRAVNSSDGRDTKAYIRREEVLYALDISMTTLRNYEARSQNKLPRHKENTAEGKIWYDMREVCEFYYMQRFRKEYGEGGAPEAGSPEKKANANEQKARLTKAQADAQELKNDVERGKLAPIQMLENALSDLSGQISSILGAIPSKLRKKYAWLKSSQLDEVETEIAKAQNAAADVRLALPDRPDESGDIGSDQQAGSEASIGTENPATH